MNRKARQEAVMTLMYQVMRQLRKRMDTDGHEAHISPYHAHALYLLSSKPLTMGELAEELSVSLPSTTVLVNKLVEHDLAERLSDSEDRRITRLTITPKGGELLAKVKEARYRKLKVFM